MLKRVNLIRDEGETIRKVTSIFKLAIGMTLLIPQGKLSLEAYQPLAEELEKPGGCWYKELSFS